VGTAARLRYGILASKGLTSNLDSTSLESQGTWMRNPGAHRFWRQNTELVSPGKVLVARVFGSAERVENQDDSFVRELGRFVDFALAFRRSSRVLISNSRHGGIILPSVSVEFVDPVCSVPRLCRPRRFPGAWLECTYAGSSPAMIRCTYSVASSKACQAQNPSSDLG